MKLFLNMVGAIMVATFLIQFIRYLGKNMQVAIYIFVYIVVTIIVLLLLIGCIFWIFGYNPTPWAFLFTIVATLVFSYFMGKQNDG